ncbi:MAG: hypothetical protein WCD86_01365 [Ktedonobacteraceae bacterium]
MPDDSIHRLVASTNRGRYALDDPNGPDLTAGDRIAILLGGQWTAGHLERSTRYEDSTPGLYQIADWGKTGRTCRPQDEVRASLAQPHDVYGGYYFIAADGTLCGLCTGMQVRILS